MCTVELPKQVTVAIIKPDAVEAGLVDEIIQKVYTVLCQILVSGVLTDAFFSNYLTKSQGESRVTGMQGGA